MEAAEGQAQFDRAAPASDTAAVSGAQNLGRIATRAPVLVILFLVALFSIVLISMELSARARRWDFSHYYVATLVLREGGNPYTADLRPLGQRLGINLGLIDRATYPPTFYLLFEPLTLLPPLAAYWLWIALTTAALAAALYLLFGPASGLSTRAGLAAAAVAISYAPIESHYYFAQCQILILLMIVAMARLMERGRETAAGAMLAMATLIRVFPVLLIGYLIMRRRWRMLAWTALWLGLGALATLALVGWDRCFSFIRVIPFIASDRFIREPANVSLSGFIAREFAYAAGIHALTIGWLRVITIGAELGVLALTVAATIPAAGVDRDDDWCALSLWIVATIMLSPTAWLHYFVLLLFVFAQMIVAAGAGRIATRALWAALASFATVDVVQPILVSLITHHGADPQALLQYRPGPGAVLIMLRAELSFLSLLALYVAAYWFASDSAPRVAHRRTVASSAG